MEIGIQISREGSAMFWGGRARKSKCFRVKPIDNRGTANFARRGVRLKR